jgi:hypothetical protein
MLWRITVDITEQRSLNLDWEMEITRTVDEGWDFLDGDRIVIHKNKVSITFMALYLAELDRRIKLDKMKCSDDAAPTFSAIIPVCHRAQEPCTAFQTVTMPSESTISKSPLKQMARPHMSKDSVPIRRNADVEDEGNTSKAWNWTPILLTNINTSKFIAAVSVLDITSKILILPSSKRPIHIWSIANLQ